MLGVNRVQKMIERMGLDEEMSKRPKGKRSTAVAKRGKHTHRCHGKHRSTCLWDGRGVRKNVR
ncbi:hypothetical protein JOE21_000074 [Desmospora profundinema]|uniref:Uncharacterized protein n=1 Tax=Desmospora profundinema TaxID=1571184 RepID=A0ABU1IH28_9BACL|nr:hypothetical protein [Desmospora profundinema]